MDAPAQNPYTPPANPEPPPKPMFSLDGATLGTRVAGGVFLVYGLIGVLLRVAFTPSQGVFTVLPGLVDFALGFSLLDKESRYRSWAVLRVVLGTVVFTGMQLASGQLLFAGAELAVSGAFLMLLLGDPGKGRIGFACATFGLYGMLAIVGLVRVFYSG